MSKILVKFPTRTRPYKFLTVLRKLVAFSNPENVKYLITIDDDDPTMRGDIVFVCEKMCKDIQFVSGKSNNKIHAVNRDMDQAGDWDILILMSDDMIPVKIGWDDIIIETMKREFPDGDGVLFFPDGYTELNTLCIMGRKYYERFGYIYHPSYHSLFCDNEFHEVADRLGKHYKDTQTLFKHEHPYNSQNVRHDNLYNINNRWHKDDQKNYQNRKRQGFK